MTITSSLVASPTSYGLANRYERTTSAYGSGDAVGWNRKIKDGFPGAMANIGELWDTSGVGSPGRMSGLKAEGPSTTIDSSQSYSHLERQSSQVSDDGELHGNDDVTPLDASASSNDNMTSRRSHKNSSQRKDMSYATPMADPKLQVDGDRAEGGAGNVGAGARPKTFSLNYIVHTVRSLGYTDNEISTSLLMLQGSQTEVTCDSLIDMSYDVRNEQIMGLVDSEATVSSSDPAQLNGEGSFEMELRGTVPSTAEKETQFKTALQNALQNKKDELKAAIDALTYKCRVCGQAEANTLLLPCAHLASCGDCLHAIRRCPMPRCNKVVRGTKEVFFT